APSYSMRRGRLMGAIVPRDFGIARPDPLSYPDPLSDGSATAGRIRNLLSDHPGLKVYACGNTIARLQRRGEQVELLEGTRRASSAVDLIVDRLQDGWRYIKA
ncbi:MAG: hypothetical protein ACLFQD_03835, partial [Thiohalospira sp.]